MVSSARQAIACILVIFGSAVSSQAQSTPATNPIASISGKVTVKGKGVARIVVVARGSYFGGWDNSRHRATTDQAGNYRITNLPAATYEVLPITASLVSENEQGNKSIVITEGETIENVDFALIRGGVITGKITDSEGQPLIEESVTLSPIDQNVGYVRFYGPGIQTDDRGVYRAFGLRPGKYKVFVGQEKGLPGGRRLSYRQTFYPSVTDAAKATVVEVTEGGETNNVDIVLGRPVRTFKVSGRIIDGETGKPLPRINYGVQQVSGNGNSSQSLISGAFSNTEGEFRFESVLPGKYFVFIVPPDKSEIGAESLPFEVIDRDLSGLVIKTSKGASVSGVLVFEGSEEKTLKAKPFEVEVHFWFETPSSNYESRHPTFVNADGTFKLSGLRHGLAHLSLSTPNRPGLKRLALVRVERDGVVQPRGIEVKEGEQIAGLRLVVKYVTGAIRGQVKVEDGELPPSSRMFLSVQLLEENLSPFNITTSSGSSPELDSRGRFLVEGLAAGTYEVTVTVFDGRTANTIKQQVIVTDNAVSEVTLTIKAKPGP